MSVVWVLSVVQESDLVAQMVAGTSSEVRDMAIGWYKHKSGGVWVEAERHNVLERIEKHVKGSSVYLRHHHVLEEPCGTS